MSTTRMIYLSLLRSWRAWTRRTRSRRTISRRKRRLAIRKGRRGRRIPRAIRRAMLRVSLPRSSRKGTRAFPRWTKARRRRSGSPTDQTKMRTRVIRMRSRLTTTWMKRMTCLSAVGATPMCASSAILLVHQFGLLHRSCSTRKPTSYNVVIELSGTRSSAPLSEATLAI